MELSLLPKVRNFAAHRTTSCRVVRALAEQERTARHVRNGRNRVCRLPWGNDEAATFSSCTLRSSAARIDHLMGSSGRRFRQAIVATWSRRPALAGFTADGGIVHGSLDDPRVLAQNRFPLPRFPTDLADSCRTGRSSGGFASDSCLLTVLRLCIHSILINRSISTPFQVCRASSHHKMK